MTHIHIIKTVSKNIFSDIYADILNAFGANLTPYESMVSRGMQQIYAELGSKRLKWYQITLSPISKNAVIILLYGETK